MSKEKRISRDIEKVNLLKKLVDIDKEEEEIDVNRNIKRKIDIGSIVLDEVMEVINLTEEEEEDKKFLESKSSST
jgi:hypothetical protein